ncbi:MAG: hypothetical protein E7553_01365 [Ruminococcaceae bacterium]|nr:hypothetical protein [Oscillospiraceae bacterium]
MIIFFVIGAVCALFAGWHGLVLYIFKCRPHLTAKAAAWREDTVHKKNQYCYGGRGRWIFIKDETRARYRYKVGGKSYDAKVVRYYKPSDTAYLTLVIYWKRFPWIHTVVEAEDEISDALFSRQFWCLLFGVLALLFFLFGWLI